MEGILLVDIFSEGELLAAEGTLFTYEDSSSEQLINGHFLFLEADEWCLRD